MKKEEEEVDSVKEGKDSAILNERIAKMVKYIEDTLANAHYHDKARACCDDNINFYELAN